MFKYIRKDNKFRWESDFMALEFSNPTIQAFSNFQFIDDSKEIMYYYYRVRIFKKLVSFDDNDKKIVKWKLVGSRRTYDFPSILELQWILDFQLKDNTKENGQITEYSSGEVRYSKVLSTEGFACDDFYEIKKIVSSSENRKDSYVVYAGVTFDIQGDLNSNGIRTPYVYTEDIESLLECVNNFIKYSIDLYNKSVLDSRNSFSIENNKVYEYHIDSNGVNKSIIDSMFSVGDNIEITIVIDNKEDEYDNVFITEISDKTIKLSNGLSVDIDTIAYIHNNPTKEALHYDENEIADDFFTILNDVEKEDFSKNSIRYLLKKYKTAIIDRTWMCREEHNFNIDYKSPDRVESVTPIVVNIIKIIKSKIK